MGLRGLERVHEAAFLASVFTYSAGTEDIPQCFWTELTEAWESTRVSYGFPQSLVNGYLADAQNPEWCNQKWWQGHVSKVCESRWTLTVSLRLRKVKELNAARNAVDITALVSSDEGVSVVLVSGMAAVSPIPTGVAAGRTH